MNRDDCNLCFCVRVSKFEIKSHQVRVLEKSSELFQILRAESRLVELMGKPTAYVSSVRASFDSWPSSILKLLIYHIVDTAPSTHEGPAYPAPRPMMVSSNPRISSSTMSSFLPTFLIFALLVRRSVAHEHHDDKIPEGEAISPDPLV